MRNTVLHELASCIHYFPIQTVLRSLLCNKLALRIRVSAFSNSLSVYGIEIPQPTGINWPSDVTQCVYHPATKMWIYHMQDCAELCDRGLLVSCYLSMCMNHFPQCAARIIDISICTLRDLPRVTISDSSELPPLFQDCGDLLEHLTDLRASTALQQYIPEPNASKQQHIC